MRPRGKRGTDSGATLQRNEDGGKRQVAARLSALRPAFVARRRFVLHAGRIMDLDINLIVAALALALEAVIGYPPALARALGHPVMWLGALVAWLDRTLNRETLPMAQRKLLGVAALAILLAAAVVPSLAVQLALMSALPLYAAPIVVAALASLLLAQRSLWSHVAAVADGLEQDGLTGGRAAVSHIVGRNPESLDEAGVVRAAIESLAENFSDGVVAPALWCAALGLPGIAAYKAVNTADSMIGHRTKRHQAFGWAAARFDDLVNLPASRLSALWLVLAALLQPGASAAGAIAAVRRDSAKHRSPNAGWPEAAMAGALGLRLNGPRIYGTTRVEDHWMGNGRAEATVEDLRRALELYRTACAIQLAAAALVAALIWRS
jgi:adenosylcobinamide-phosphate synthase